MQTFHLRLCPHRGQEVTYCAKSPLITGTEGQPARPALIPQTVPQTTCQMTVLREPASASLKDTRPQPPARSLLQDPGVRAPLKEVPGSGCGRERFSLETSNFVSCQHCVFKQTQGPPPGFFLCLMQAVSSFTEFLDFERGQYFPRFHDLKPWALFSFPFNVFLSIDFLLVLSPLPFLPRQYILKGNIISRVSEQNW